jgi:hypothetical protein
MAAHCLVFIKLSKPVPIHPTATGRSDFAAVRDVRDQLLQLGSGGASRAAASARSARITLSICSSKFGAVGRPPCDVGRETPAVISAR